MNTLITRNVNEGWVHIETQSITEEVATVDFESQIDNRHTSYVLVFRNVIPADDGVHLYIRVGTGGTPTYQAGDTDYNYLATLPGSAGTLQTATFMQITAEALGSDTNEGGFSGDVYFYNPASASLKTQFKGNGVGENETGGVATHLFTGLYTALTAITAVRVLMSAGNIESGSISLYGIKTK